MITHVSAGSSWLPVDGKLVWISSGSSGKVWGINEQGNVLKREGITSDNPTGTDWQLLTEELAQVSVWGQQAWGVKKNNKIFFAKLQGDKTGITI